MKNYIKKVLLVLIFIFIYQTGFTNNAVIIERAKRFYAQNKFHLARDLFEQALRSAPLKFDEDSCLMLGNIYNHQGNFAEAVKMFERGLEIALPKNRPIFYINIAQSYRHLKNYIKSLEALNTVKDYSDKYPEIFLYEGMAYFQLRDKEKTIQSWEAYLVKVPYGSQSDTIRKAIAWLRNPTFKWPEEIEREQREAEIARRQNEVQQERQRAAAIIALERQNLQRAAEERRRLEEQERQRIAAEERARQEQQRRLQELERQRREQQEREQRLLAELRQRQEEERLRRLQEQRDRVNIQTRQISPRDRGREEGQRYDEIER